MENVVVEMLSCNVAAIPGMVEIFVRLEDGRECRFLIQTAKLRTIIKKMEDLLLWLK